MAENSEIKTINIALQGGGAHGAFSWGVLDRLLEDERIEIEGICSASAGTMNACALAYGLHLGEADGGGRERARETLARFWRTVHEVGETYSPIRQMPWPAFLGGVENSPAWLWFDAMTRTFSPYQMNPFDFNPLKEVLERCIDFEALRDGVGPTLVVAATNVRTGKLRVFDAAEISVDVALASACLPHLFKAVEIDGEHYWDGGYMGNPPLFPLLAKTQSHDLMIIHLNPMERPELPTTGAEIMNRLNEISFNTPLMKEMGTLSVIKMLKRFNLLSMGIADHFKEVHIHSIPSEQALGEYSIASKYDTSWPFLLTLHERGRAAVSAWLEENFDNIGKRDTADLSQTLPEWIAPLFRSGAIPPSGQPAGANGAQASNAGARTAAG